MNQKIFSINPRPFGLDLSDLSLKSVFLEESGDIDTISSFGSVPLPSGAVSDGEIIKSGAVIEAIQTLIEKSGPKQIPTKQVVCSLPEVKAFLRIINLPIMDEAEAKEAVKWEIEANIPLTLDQVYYDSQILSRNLSKENNKMSALVVVVAKTVVDQFVGTLEAAGLEVVGLETESIAQARSLLSEDENDQTTLIIDIGDRSTSFLVSIGNTPCFTSSIPLSSQMVTDAISKSMRVSFEEAEALKITYGIGSSLKKDPLFNAVAPVIESLIVEIQRSIDFYLTGLRYSSAIDTVVLCGGGSNMVGLLPYLSQRLNMPVQFGNPWVNLRLGKHLPPIEKKKSVQYSTAIGLALRNVKAYGD
ncbi:MAG: type IV pilus assembly protein PilM [Candidatus Moranbacteria bacterium]|nr:type IV pilus assembly protein PilM [Candidatus Moranbacteria bacterium]